MKEGGGRERERRVQTDRFTAILPVREIHSNSNRVVIGSDDFRIIVSPFSKGYGRMFER